MQVRLRQISVDEKEILRNLLEKYDYEFSQWDQRDVNALGLYGYGYLDNYWTEEKRYAFFIEVDGKLAGFAMVNDYPEVSEPVDYVMAEYCVLFKYRRCGVGRTAAYALFDRFHGRWQLKRHPKNLASVAFWDSVVSGYTQGRYRLVCGHEEAAYDDGTKGDIFFFET